jgi:hypothetical protein
VAASSIQDSEFRTQESSRDKGTAQASVTTVAAALLDGRSKIQDSIFRTQKGLRAAKNLANSSRAITAKRPVHIHVFDSMGSMLCLVKLFFAAHHA